ncbi:MAG: hypothetical protein Aureis2KO_26650 [Aureisphaera sp.]
MSKFLSLLISFLMCHSLVFSQNEKQKINNSFIAFAIAEKDLLPESIAYDPVHRDFFMGSTRKGKVIKISEDGTSSEYITPKSNGLWMTVGLKIDAQRRVLWVCSSGGENLEGYNLKDDSEGRPAGVFKYDLDSGKLINKFTLEDKGGIHFFNDLVIAKNGDVYITHMFKEHAIYKISSSNNTLQKYNTSSIVKYPNGITLSNDESKLYIAHAEGIAYIELKNGIAKEVKVPSNLKIKHRESIDGLYFYKNSLIGVQSDIGTIQQFHLNEAKDEIVSTELLEVNHPMMDHPTTGEIINDHFYYIANAQFGSFSEDGSLYPMEQLYEPIILKVKLK